MILNPLASQELDMIFDNTSLEVLKLCIKKCIIAQPERLLGQPVLPIQVPKEHIEQWVVQAVGGTPVGAGSYPVDIITENAYGKYAIDIKMLSCKVNSSGTLSNTTSGETSLAQKFIGPGIDLDTSFHNKQYEQIVTEWINILENKFRKVNREHGINNIYYIFVLRADNKFYLCATKVNTDNIKNMKANPQKTTKESIFIENIINDNFGNAKIYKAKKRLELRLKPKYWVDNNLVKTFDFSHYIPPTINLRQIVETKKQVQYFQDITAKFIY
ncbi:hypothetical protein AN641_01645 [Candidatus Epulonipiscioides gigas]|nr:hypothetical protein AN641_01645 [Epulopiscium sp. SCG-C07WGA-EpuloA2]